MGDKFTFVDVFGRRAGLPWIFFQSWNVSALISYLLVRTLNHSRYSTISLEQFNVRRLARKLARRWQ
jgi:hypothetical protein